MLVIIGLIVGGVLVGQDLIRAAYVRAQITQIEKFNTAVNTFYGKYQSLPGDMNPSVANSYGFATRGLGSAPGWGDGDGLLEITLCGPCGVAGEESLFWMDLSSANGLNVNLIEGSYLMPNMVSTYVGSQIGQFLPVSKLGGGNYAYVFSMNGLNYYGVSMVTSIITANYLASQAEVQGAPGLSVSQAYNIDRKTDDGFPQSGRVIAGYLNTRAFKWADGDTGAGDGTATPPASSSCYDDGGTTGAIRQYSTSTNKGTATNCALSFQFQ